MSPDELKSVEKAATLEALKHWTVENGEIGYDGKNGPVFSLITAHQAFLKRAEASPDFDGMTSGILVRRDDDTIEEREGDFHLRDEVQNVVGGWAKVFHKKRHSALRLALSPARPRSVLK